MCTAYAHRGIDPYASLNVLYSRQFDGGYIHREHDVRDGLPVIYEPGFSPNPPIMSVAEWQIAKITGNTHRLRQVYPVLKGYHEWLRHNRQLPDGTYWTTGLANGLDNSPSLGDGYPDLTAQMAHDAEVLAQIARIIGEHDEAQQYRAEHNAIAQACNAHLWSETMQIYATSLQAGGHNPNKVVTAFWPFWAGIVPPERADALAQHAADPTSFWRHHPFPSLAADSPWYVPEGQYWRGSAWPPTNYAAIKGLHRAGKHALARDAALRHVQCVWEVFKSTGKIWENYCAEASKPGNWAGPDYCWSALGPIAVLIEVIIGIEADALHRTLRWRIHEQQRIGIRKFPLGNATLDAVHQRDSEGRWGIDVDTDRPFTLEVHAQGRDHRFECSAGHSRWLL
jgi:glycogen debranching enzyme